MNYSKNDVAAVCGVSTQAIDKRLDAQNLRDRCIKSSSRRLYIPDDVAVEIVRFYEPETDEAAIIERLTIQAKALKPAEEEVQVSSGVETNDETSQNLETSDETKKAADKTLELLERTIEMLQEELRSKTGQIQEKDEQIAKWEAEANGWKEAFLKEKETSQAAQLLHAADKRGELMPPEEQEEPAEVVAEQEEEPKKKGFFARWFK